MLLEYSSFWALSTDRARKHVCPNPAVSSPGGSVNKESTQNAEDLGLIPGSGNSPEVGNGNSLRYSCLKNSMDRGTWWAIVHGVAKSWTQLRDEHLT